jgi:hypothetical protein
MQDRITGRITRLIRLSAGYPAVSARGNANPRQPGTDWQPDTDWQPGGDWQPGTTPDPGAGWQADPEREPDMVWQPAAAWRPRTARAPQLTRQRERHVLLDRLDFLDVPNPQSASLASTPSTSSSGTEAPLVTPTVVTPSSQRSSTSPASSTR